MLYYVRLRMIYFKKISSYFLCKFFFELLITHHK